MADLTGSTSVHTYGIFGSPYGSFGGKNNSTIFVFDIRIMDRAVSDSGGVAVGSDNGAISYFFDDMKSNDGQVTQPWG